MLYYIFVYVRTLGHIPILRIAVANDQVQYDGVGDIQITVPDGRNGKRARLTQALHVPDLRTNLMSVSKITDQGHEVTFRKNAVFQTKRKTLVERV